jgi:hypothetical protein
MSEKKTQKPRAKKKPKATGIVQEPATNRASQRADFFAEALAKPGIQKLVRKISEGWRTEFLDDEDARFEYIRDAYEELVANLTHRIAIAALIEHHGAQTILETIGEEANTASDRWRQAFAEARFQENAEKEARELASSIDQNATDLLFWNLMEEASDALPVVADETTKGTVKLLDGNILTKETRKQHGSYLRQSIIQFAFQFAQQTVERELQRGGSLLDTARRLRLLKGETFTTFFHPTHAMTLPMRNALLSTDLSIDSAQQVTIGRGKSALVVKTEMDLTGLVGENYLKVFPAESIASFYKNLIQRKGIGLYKVHLDLTSEAYRAGGGKFLYNYADALERQGYTRNERRQGFHNEAYKALDDHVVLLDLTRFTILKRRSTSGNDVEVRTAYWKSTLEVRERREDIGELFGKRGRVYTTANIMLPGEWWSFAEMNKYRMEVPKSILELPVDDHKNKTNFFVLLLASFLAIHVRRNQEQHAGKKVAIGVGTVLEESGITTFEEFMNLKPQSAKRVRDYLQSANGTGALTILERHQACTVNIRDEEEFFAIGSRWKERFWNAMLLVDVPNLGIAKRPKKYRRG